MAGSKERDAEKNEVSAADIAVLLEEVCQTIVGWQFDTPEDAGRFYTDYAKVRGFTIKKRQFRRNVHGVNNSNTWVCSRSGNGEGQGPKILQIDCKAKMKVRLDEKKNPEKWVVDKFQDDHNHELQSLQHVRFFSQYRNVSPEDLNLATLARTAGIGTSKIINFLAVLAGGLHHLEFIPRDIYNELDADARNSKKQNRDAECALGCMATKQSYVPGFFYKHLLDSTDRLSHLLWADGTSRADYSCFGDLVILDSTYKTNCYGQPLVIFAGVSNHHKTIVFALGLVHDETEPTYTWLLRTFIEAMGGKPPQTIVTDQDHAMKGAIANALSGTKHRLCGWHILRNAPKYVPSKGFTDDLRKFVYEDLSITEFEQGWTQLKADHNLNLDPTKKNDWAEKLYDTRHMWATAYLRGYFCGKVRTTQRVEGMNARVKDGVRGSMRFTELIGYIDVMLDKTRFIQAMAEHESVAKTLKTPPIHRQIYKHASLVFTPKSMEDISEQLMMSGGLCVDSVANWGRNIEYVIRDSEGPRRWLVNYTRDSGGEIKCQCRYFETVGFPCSHIFLVMKNEGLTQIPECLIKRRWTKFAKHGSTKVWTNTDQPKTKESRYASLMLTAGRLMYLAADDDVTYDAAQLALEKMGRTNFGNNKNVPTKGRARDPAYSTKKRWRRSKITKQKKSQDTAGCEPPSIVQQLHEVSAKISQFGPTNHASTPPPMNQQAQQMNPHFSQKDTSQNTILDNLTGYSTMDVDCQPATMDVDCEDDMCPYLPEWSIFTQF